jgi:hypothetical protein
MTYDLPDNEFFLSIAPYMEQTHPCATHSLTGCQGEIKNGEFSVTVHDSEGNVIMENAAMQSQSNGFIDLWLPRDKTYRISVNHEGKRAETEFSTYENNDTWYHNDAVGLMSEDGSLRIDRWIALST